MKIAVVGATGLVGREILKVLEERYFPVMTFLAVASEKSVGKPIEFQGKTYSIVSIENAVGLYPSLPGKATVDILYVFGTG